MLRVSEMLFLYPNVVQAESASCGKVVEGISVLTILSLFLGLSLLGNRLQLRLLHHRNTGSYQPCVLRVQSTPDPLADLL